MLHFAIIVLIKMWIYLIMGISHLNYTWKRKKKKKEHIYFAPSSVEKSQKKKSWMGNLIILLHLSVAWLLILLWILFGESTRLCLNFV